MTLIEVTLETRNNWLVMFFFFLVNDFSVSFGLWMMNVDGNLQVRLWILLACSYYHYLRYDICLSCSCGRNIYIG